MEAWKPVLNICGAVLINLTLGTFYSIGNLIPYVASYMRNNGNPTVTSEHGTWITASFLMGQGLFIIVGAYLEQVFDSRVACIFGCMLHTLSTFLTMWAVNVNFLAVILIYGFGSGLGCGSAYMASIIAAQKWFPHSKGIVTGLIVGGFGFGGLIFTFLQTLYMNPSNSSPNSLGYFDEPVYNRVPHLFMYMGLVFAVVQAIGCALASPPPAQTRAEHQQMESDSPHSGAVTVVDNEELPKLKSFCSIFRYRILYLIGAMMMLVAPGVTFVNSLGKRYGQSYIVDDRFLSLVVAVSAIANAVGRFTWGYMMDKLSFSTCFTAKVVLFAAMIVTFPYAFILSSKALYLIWMLGLFFGFSGTFVLFPVFIEQVFGVRFHGMIYGLLYIFLALSSIMTSLIIQVTIVPAMKGVSNPDENLLSRILSCVTIAVLYCLSLVLYRFLVPVQRLETAIKRKIDTDRTKTRNSLVNRQDLYPLERPTLAEKTTSEGIRGSEGGIRKENSLGSIVRYVSSPTGEVGKLKKFAK